MKKLVLFFASLVLIFCFSTPASAAALPNGSLLTIDLGFNGASSYFVLYAQTAGDATTFLQSTNYNNGTPLSKSTDGGIILGTAQPMNPLGFHSGMPTSSDRGPIDKPWSFFGSTGSHFTVGSGITDNGDGTLDMTNWRMAWSGIPEIDLGGDLLNTSDTGIATFTVSGTKYTVDYNVTITPNSPLHDIMTNGTSTDPITGYTLHLEGRIMAVPEPASLLLLGSGLTGIFAIFRRKE